MAVCNGRVWTGVESTGARESFDGDGVCHGPGQFVSSAEIRHANQIKLGR